MQEVKKRIEWIDIGKYICIMFVMLTHLDSGSVILDKFFNPFFLTMFFFLSGYVYKQPQSFKEHIVKKAKGLLVPWIIFSNLNIVLSMLITLKENRNFATEFFWNFLQIRSHGDGLWFLAALFVAFIPFYFFVKWGNPSKACVTAVILSVVSVLYTHIFPAHVFPWGSSMLPWHLEYMFQAMMWMLLGYYFRIYGEKIFDRYNTVINRIAVWVLYLIAAYIPDSIGGGYLSIPLSYIRSTLGIIAVMCICKIIKSNWYIQYVGANTLLYFAIHGKFLALIQSLLSKFAGGFYRACLNNDLASSALAIVITFILSVVLIIPSKLINRWVPWAIGKKRYR